MDTPLSSPTTRRRRGRGRWFRIAAGAFIFYTIFGFLILPLIVRSVAANQISKQLDRKVTIQKVRINPFVLSATVRGLLIADKDGEPFVSWEEFYGNFQLSSFFGKPWVFKELRLSQPFVRVQINQDYSFNFSDILKKLSESSPVPTKPKPPPLLTIERLEIAGAHAKFTDLTPKTPFQRIIGPVHAVMTQFHTDPTSKNPYSFSGTSDSGESFSWSGYFLLDPIQSAGEVSLEGLSIPKCAPLYQDLVRFEVRDGTVGFRSEYSFSLSGSNWFGAISNAAFSLKSFKLADKKASEKVVEVDSVDFRGLTADVGARTARMESFSVDGCRVDLRRDRDSSLNLIQLSQPAESATNTPGGILFLLQAVTNAVAALVSSTNIWAVNLDEMQVTNCAVSWEDLANARPVRARIDDFAFRARRLSNVAGTNQEASIAFRWNTNGTVAVEATAEIAPPSAKTAIHVRDVDLQPLDPYLAPFINLFIRNSRISLDGDLVIRVESNALPAVSFKGDAELDDFASVDGLVEEDLLKWRALRIAGLDASLNPPAIGIKQISLVEPCARITIETNSDLNLLAVLHTTKSNSPPPPPTVNETQGSGPAKKGGLGERFGSLLQEALESSKTQPGQPLLPKVAVDSISISNGCATFTDRSVQPTVTTSVVELNGLISGISSDELKRADLHFSGKANRTGLFEVSGKINPLSSNAATELVLTLHDLDLSPASTYSGRFLGYKINRGALGLDVGYQISNRQLRATNVLRLGHLTLGDKVESPDATRLPVRLAVALLKDRNGNILLDVPIEGSLDDPQFHFGKVITRVLENIITKLVTSPFAALGSLFGGKGEEVSFLDFASGSADISAWSMEKMQTLVKGLEERPALQVEIEGGFDPVADAEGLRHQKLERQLRRQKWVSLRKSEQTRTPEDQVVLSPDERRYFAGQLYRAVLKTNATVAAVDLHAAQPSRRLPAAQKQPAYEKSSGSATAKGAGQLLRGDTAAASVAGADAVENAASIGMNVTDEDFRSLASNRAKAVHERLAALGKLEPDRILLAPAASTNQAARVFFQLR